MPQKDEFGLETHNPPTSPKESFLPSKEDLVFLIQTEHNYTELIAMITNIAR